MQHSIIFVGKNYEEISIMRKDKNQFNAVDFFNKILKTIEDKKMFVDMLANPPEPNSKLKTAHERYLKHLRANGNSNSKTE